MENTSLLTLPHDLFVSKLPTGEKEFFCSICFPTGGGEPASLSWKLTFSQGESLSSERAITKQELEQGRVSVSAILPPAFESGELTVWLASYQATWPVQSYSQKDKFRLPLEGQVLVVVGHRIGETHRSAFQIPSQQFAWDLVPLHQDGLRLLKRSLSGTLEAQDFAGFGQPVLAPGEGVIVKAEGGNPDLTQVGELPGNLDYYLEDITRATGNYVIIDHGNEVWSCLAHLKQGSVQVKEGQHIKTWDTLGELGNSGFSSGPHVHLHFMNGPDLLAASPLPIALDVEAGTYAPGAGEITSSEV